MAANYRRGARNNRWRIQLDEGTVFTTSLPDPDVQIC